MSILHAIAQAFETAFFMFWDVLWPLVLGMESTPQPGHEMVHDHHGGQHHHQH